MMVTIPIYKIMQKKIWMRMIEECRENRRIYQNRENGQYYCKYD